MWRRQSEFQEAHAPNETRPDAKQGATAAGPAEPTSSAEPADAAALRGEADAGALREQVIDQLRTIFDPEIPVNIYELGLIYEVSVGDDGKAKIRMTLTTPMCPAAEELPPEVETKARGVPGITSVELDLVWDPPWSPAMMSEAAKLDLGMV